MSALDTIEALFRYNGLNYEVLTGDKEVVESVRVNDQYRIEFTSSVVSGEETLTICNIIELTNHYK